MIMTRRGFFKWLKRISLVGLGTATYGFVIEPGLMMNITSWAFTPQRWTPGLKLRVVLLADPHLADPQFPLSRWRRVIETANALEPDLILLLGDYMATHRFVTNRIPVQETAKAAAALRAPLGVHAILGNHDWWSDRNAQRTGNAPDTYKAFEDVGIPVFANRATQLRKDGLPFWLSGTDSMIAIVKSRGNFESRADIAGTLAQITDDSPVIHMAHEPDLFVDIPDRISLTLSGHTHGGQVRLFGWSPIVPTMYGQRFAYGRVSEGPKELVVSGGLGCSTIPVRFGMPPEITVLELG
jgi:predicted MPP superfamily phosphohydrolase